MFNPAAATSLAAMDPGTAAATVWLDGLITNPDRTTQNPNLLVWHGRTWLIDHGAALYIHHTWREPEAHARRPFERLAEHVLLPLAGSLIETPTRDSPASWTARRSARSWPRSRTHGSRTIRWVATPRASAACTWLSRAAPDGAAALRQGGRACPTPPRDAFQYAVIRVVPRVERGEQVNVGVDPALPQPALPGGADRARRGTARGGRPGSRPGDGPLASRCDRAHRRGRPIGRADRPAGARGAVPLAGLASQHDHPAVRGPHRLLRRPGARAGRPRGDARPLIARRAAGARRPGRRW